MAYVMVVDDNEDLAAAMAFALRENGHEVLTSLDTAAALAEMRKRRPDLVVLDVMFPGDDFAGFELARAMSKSPALKGTPILMLTGVNRELGMAFSAFDVDNTWLPVTEFLEKPVDFGVLAGKVGSMLQGAAARSGGGA